MKKMVQTIIQPRMLLIAVMAVLSARMAWGITQKPDQVDTPQIVPVRLTVSDRPVERHGQASYANVIKKVSPSVVKIRTTVKARPAALPNIPGWDHPSFRRFFGEGFGGDGLPRPSLPPQHGEGSGVIVTEEGYLLTNHHVVEGADAVQVTLQDGRELDAKVVGRDPKTDIAVLKVEAKDLPAVEIANSDLIEVGDVVLAIGNPFGIGQTVTLGIVSATGRATLGLDYEDFIQTDAAINPGNSGGALVDAEGRLIGINTAILSRSGGNQGIGFAIPTNLARGVMESLIQHGKVTRGYLGVMIQDLTPALADAFDVDAEHGVLVSDVLPDGPADQGGLKSGDVIVQLNGKPVQNGRQLKFAVAAIQPGQTIPIEVRREGRSKTLEVTLQTLPGDPALAESGARQASENGTLQGVVVADLDSRNRRNFEVPEEIRGVLVTEVEAESAAREAGLRAGDVILEINRQTVASADEAVRLTQRSEDPVTLVRVWSRGASRYLVIDESQS